MKRETTASHGKTPYRTAKAARCLLLTALFMICFALCAGADTDIPAGSDPGATSGSGSEADNGKKETSGIAKVSEDVIPVNTWVDNRYYGPDGKKVKGLYYNKIIRKSTKKELRKKARLIIVGASRVVYMAEHVKSPKTKQVIFIAKKQATYKWLRREGGVKLRAYLDIFPKSTVVIQLGNNSLRSRVKRPDIYFNYYHDLLQDYPKAKFYFMDALPSKDKARNKLRKIFNSMLKAEFPKQYIGGYSYLMKHHFQTTPDGEHYTRPTSRMIYKYILKKIKWK